MDFNKALELGKDVSMDIEKAKKYGLNSSALYFNRALVYQKQRHYDKAIMDYDKSIEIDPSNPRSYYNKSIIYLKLDKVEEAKANLKIASELNYHLADSVLKTIP